MDQIDAEIRLQQLTIVRKNESSNDEPYLWVVYIKVDGSTLKILDLPHASATVFAPAGSHGDLGPGGAEMTLGAKVAIPEGIGHWRTTLQTIDGLSQTKAESNTVLAVAVVALEEDNTHDDAIEKGKQALLATIQLALNKALRKIPPQTPDVKDVTAKAETAVHDAIKSATISAFSFIPISSLLDIGAIADPDDLVGTDIAGPFSFSAIRKAGAGGIPFTLNMGNKDNDDGWYQVSGHVRNMGPFFMGVWHPGNNSQIFEVGDDFAHFAAKNEARREQGWHLTSMQRFLAGGSVAWAGVWHPGDKSQIFEVGDEFAHFAAKVTARGQLGWHLTSAQRFLAGGSDAWAGVWHPGDKNQIFEAGEDFTPFAIKVTDRGKQGWHINTMQVWPAPGDPE
jgi:hypothetical protein